MSATVFTVRRQEPEDASDLHDVYSQPNVIWGTTMLPHPSMHLWKKAGDEPRGMTRLVACADDRVVGNIALTVAASPRRRHSGDIAMAVHDSWQGRGCGYTLLSAALDLADRWLALHRIELQVYSDNERGIRLYERCGFELEGTLKDYAFRDGRYEDVYAMVRLR